MESREYSQKSAIFEISARRSRVRQVFSGSAGLLATAVLVKEVFSNDTEVLNATFFGAVALGNLCFAAVQHSKARIAEQAAAGILVDVITGSK